MPLAQVRQRVIDRASTVVRPPVELHRHGGTHRDVRGGGFRVGVFGVSDGLVSNVSLVLGTAAAHPGAGVVRLAGLAGLVGGAFSMATGEYISMAGQREALERELEVERTEIADSPADERHELEAIYIERGISAGVASALAAELMANPEIALATHAREELGIDPAQLGSPLQAAGSSFVTFVVGAFIPLVAFLGGSSTSTAIFVAMALTATAALAVGALLAYFTSRPVWFSAARSLGICAVAGAATYGIGALIGASAR